jgi:hypothetical protein
MLQFYRATFSYGILKRVRTCDVSAGGQPPEIV